MKDPTERFARYVTTAYDWLNNAFWDGKLPPALVTLQRGRSYRGYFAAGRFVSRTGEGDKLDEIALNPDLFTDRDDRDIVSTLLHEMVHLWQEKYGKPSRGGYHNGQWAEEMLRVGLEPVSYSNPGKYTGQKVSHTIMEDGPYAKLWPSLADALEADGLLNDAWASEAKPKNKAANKVKYTCPSCDANVWGKPDLSVFCGDCEEAYISQGGNT